MDVETLADAIRAYFLGDYPVGEVHSRADAEAILKEAAEDSLDRRPSEAGEMSTSDGLGA